jgi:hypothetical protein
MDLAIDILNFCLQGRGVLVTGDIEGLELLTVYPFMTRKWELGK